MKLKDGKVKIDDVKNGRVYIGLQNPSNGDGVLVSIEVVAILKEVKFVDEWTAKSMDKIKSDCLGNFNTGGTGKDEVCDCLVAKITSEKKPSEWMNSSSSSRISVMESRTDNCFTETNNQDLKDAELKFLADEKKRIEDLNARSAAVTELMKEAASAGEFKEYDEAFSKMEEAVQALEEDKELKSLIKAFDMAVYHNSVAWYALLNNDLDNCSAFLRSGMKYDHNNMYIWGNKGLYHLVKGDYDEAKEAFTKFKRKEKLPNSDKKWIEVLGEDLELLESLGMGNDDFDKMRKELNIDQSLRDQFKNKFKKKD